jgi:hypothetical protein
MLILTKACTKCGEEKEFTEFSRKGKSLFGFVNYCKSCKAEYTRDHNKKFPDKKKDADKNYYLNNADRIKGAVKVYAKENKDSLRPKHLARTVKRRVEKLNRTPKWLTDSDFKQIKCMYELSDRLSSCLGIRFHVDHIIPLQGREVSGLHTPNNLQVIPAIINLQKGNKWELCKQ